MKCRLAEAQALLAALAGTDAVKAERRGRDALETARRLCARDDDDPRIRAEDTKAALARAEASGRKARTAEYWTLLYGRINADMMTGDHRAARAGAETFGRGRGRRAAGPRSLRAADARLPQVHGRRPRRRPGRHRAGARRLRREADAGLGSIFGGEFRASALATLAQVCWALGDIDRGVRLADEAERLAKASGLPVAQAHALFNRLQLVANFGARKPSWRRRRRCARSRTRTTSGSGARSRRPIPTGRRRAAASRARTPFAPGSRPSASAAPRCCWPPFSPCSSTLNWPSGGGGRPCRRSTTASRSRTRRAAAMRPHLLRLRGDALAEDDPAGALAAYREALREAQAQGARYNALLTALAWRSGFSPQESSSKPTPPCAPRSKGFRRSHREEWPSPPLPILRSTPGRRGNGSLNSLRCRRCSPSAGAARGARGDRGGQGGARKARHAREAARGLRARLDDDQGVRRRGDEGGARAGGKRRGNSADAATLELCTAASPPPWPPPIKSARAGARFLAEAETA